MAVAPETPTRPNRFLSDEEKRRHAAVVVGVRPQSTWAPRFLKRMAWRIEGHMMSLIAKFDPYHPPDSKLSLRVMWWKSIYGNDRTSPAFDQGLTSDLLPTGFRFFVNPVLCRFFPRWVHPIIETRTAYLDREVRRICQEQRQRQLSKKKIRLITVGAGYDVRSLKLRELLDDTIELDLSPVVHAKRLLLTSERFRKRRPQFASTSMLPTWYEVDLNDSQQLVRTLQEVVKHDTEAQWHTIFLFEGVLMYLNEGIPTEALRICRESLVASGGSGSLVFADKVEGIPKEDDESVASQVLIQLGWRLTDWLPKGPSTRHMGRAESA